MLDCRFSGTSVSCAIPRNNRIRQCGFLYFFKNAMVRSVRSFLSWKGAEFFHQSDDDDLAMHAKARRRRPAKYVLQLDDQFIFPDR